MNDIMMDLGGKALGEALTSLIVKACMVLYGSTEAPPKVSFDVGSFVIQSPHTGNEISLTHSDLDDLASFLQTPEATAITQSYVLLACIQKRHPGLDRHLQEIRNAFFALAKYWGEARGGRPWTQCPEEIWHAVTKNMELAAPDQIAVSRLPERDVTGLVDTVTSGGKITQVPAPRYVRLTSEITSDQMRLIALRELCSDICRAVSNSTSEMHLDHAAERHRFSHDDLYIGRTVTPRTKLAYANLGAIFENPLPGARLVVFGHPGVGKSTLVNNFVFKLSQRPNRDFAPLVVKCRELGTHLESSCLNHLQKVIAHDLGLRVTGPQVEDIVAVGRAFVVYDGLDEVTDLQQRRKLVRGIELFASTYPLTSIICTTRKIGYESARFPEGSFPSFELEEYSQSQVIEYAKRWFTLMNRREVDTIAFLNESAEIAEIRKNPLMLSLLCTLYKVRGFIPMNRRDVYKDCADLLFYSWDAMRRIPQPVDHRRYGHTLMEELADLFFKFPSTAGGIEEGQLIKLIAGYFVDTAGVDPVDAQTRAKDFLDFCAGRAWLLTARGHTDRGGRLFAFTHRTFMEFYAAEAVVRRAKDQETVLETALEVYRKNPSSVLTDLIFEAYENKQHRGAEILLRALMREGAEGRKVASGAHIPLCLRVLNSTPVGAPLVAEVLATAFYHWSKSRKHYNELVRDERAFTSLLQLYRDPRQICSRLLLEDGYALKALVPHLRWTKDSQEQTREAESLRRKFRLTFLHKWARIATRSEADPYATEWEQLAQSIVNIEGPNAAEASEWIRLYYVLRGFIPVETRHIVELPLTLGSFDDPVPGLVLQSLGAALFAEPTRLHQEVMRVTGELLQKNPLKLNDYTANNVDKALLKIISRYPASQITCSTVSQETALVALWLALVSAEVKPGSLHPFQQAIKHLYGEDLLYRMFRTRLGTKEYAHEATDEIAELAPLSPDEKSAFLANFPKWVKAWVNRRRRLLAGEP